jgi:hypothetical protein
LVGRGVAVRLEVGLRMIFAVLEAVGVSVAGAAVGKGVIGTVGESVTEIVTVSVGSVSKVLPVHPQRKITNKTNMTTLDEFNGIKGPFVTLRIVVLVLEYRRRL